MDVFGQSPCQHDLSFPSQLDEYRDGDIVCFQR